jgi:hypothetical protein
MTTTTASQWRAKREQGVELELPEYGDMVRIRPMDATFFFKTGRIPDYLSTVVDDLINNRIKQVPVPPIVDTEKTVEWLKWLDELVTYALVSPKVVATPQTDDEITIEDIGYTDKLHIYRFFGQPAATLRFLRDQKSQSVAAVADPKRNGRPAEQTAEGAPVVVSDAGNAR